MKLQKLKIKIKKTFKKLGADLKELDHRYKVYQRKERMYDFTGDSPSNRGMLFYLKHSDEERQKIYEQDRKEVYELLEKIGRGEIEL